MNYSAKLFKNRKIIYKLSINKRIYIGSSKDFYTRLMSHISALKRNKHANKYLQRAYNKYNYLNIEILEILNQESTRKKLLKREKYYIDLLSPDFNLILDPIENTFSKEIKIQISNTLKEKYKKGELINPWVNRGDTYDVYNYRSKKVMNNVYIKDIIKKYKISNRSVVLQAVKSKRFYMNRFEIFVVKHKSEFNKYLSHKRKSKKLPIYRSCNNGMSWKKIPKSKKMIAKLKQNNIFYSKKNNCYYAYFGYCVNMPS